MPLHLVVCIQPALVQLATTCHSQCKAVFDQAVSVSNPKTSILIQRRHPYAGNLTSETWGQ